MTVKTKNSHIEITARARYLLQPSHGNGNKVEMFNCGCELMTSSCASFRFLQFVVFYFSLSEGIGKKNLIFTINLLEWLFRMKRSLDQLFHYRAIRCILIKLNIWKSHIFYGKLANHRHFQGIPPCNYTIDGYNSRQIFKWRSDLGTQTPSGCKFAYESW